MAIVNPLLGTVNSWNPPGDPIDMEQIRLDREAEERREEDERARVLSGNDPRDLSVDPRNSSFQVGVHSPHPGFSSFSDYQAAIDRDPVGAGWAFSEAPGTSADQIATGYADQISDQVDKNKEQHGLFSGGLLNTLSNPLAAVSNYFDHPTNVVSPMMAPLFGPLGGAVLDAVGAYNTNKQAYNRAHAQMGTPGYSYGMLDGQHYSVEPGMFGSRSISGTVPDWFDVDMADTLQNYQMGLDAAGNATTDVGSARFSSDGYLSTPFGNDVALYDDVAALAKEYGVSYDIAYDAIHSANAGEGTLDENIGVASGMSTAAETGVAGTTMNSDEFEMEDTNVAETEDDYGDPHDEDYF
jgi:hypothetical protein